MRQAISAAWIAVHGALATGCVDRFDVGAIDGQGGGGGDGGSGALGGGGAGGAAEVSLDPFSTPVSVASASSCALRSNGGVACWGNNTNGELGHGQELVAQSSTPVTPVGLDAGVQAIFGGGAAHCALLDTDRVECWGAALYGEFNGMPVQAISFHPLDIPGLGDDIVQVALGYSWGCALTRTGQAKCWGLGGTGQLGNGGTGDAYVPGDVTSIAGERYVQLSASLLGYHTCGVTTEGGVLCWGDNAAGQLGHEGPNQPVPTAVPGLAPSIVEVAAGRDHTCARTSDGAVFCWGENAELQLGSAGRGSAPREVPGIVAQAIAAGGDQSCALAMTGPSGAGAREPSPRPRPPPSTSTPRSARSPSRRAVCIRAW